jgi:hypothetical protein
VLRLRTEKGDRQVVREIMPELKSAIDAMPVKGLALVARGWLGADQERVWGLVSRHLPGRGCEQEPARAA